MHDFLISPVATYVSMALFIIAGILLFIAFKTDTGKKSSKHHVK